MHSKFDAVNFSSYRYNYFKINGVNVQIGWHCTWPDLMCFFKKILLRQTQLVPAIFRTNLIRSLSLFFKKTDIRIWRWNQIRLARAQLSPGQLPRGREQGLLPRQDRRGEGFERDSTEPKGSVDGLIYTKSLLPTHRYMMRRTIDDSSL